MAVPKKKTSTSKRNMRRSHDGIKAINILENKTSGELQLPHQVSVDGYYNGKKVIKDKVKAVEGEVIEETKDADKKEAAAKSPKAPNTSKASKTSTK